MKTNIENKMGVKGMVNKYTCPHCHCGISFANVATWYTSVIGSRNPGRKLSAEEARAMRAKRTEKHRLGASHGG